MDMESSLQEKIYNRANLKMKGLVDMEYLIMVMKQHMKDIGLMIRKKLMV